MQAPLSYAVFRKTVLMNVLQLLLQSQICSQIRGSLFDVSLTLNCIINP